LLALRTYISWHLDFDIDMFGDMDDLDSLDSLDSLEERMALGGHDIGIHEAYGDRAGAVLRALRELEDDEDEDDGYESSFVEDDNEGDGARPTIDLSRELGRNARNGRRRRDASVIVLSSGGEDDDDEEGNADENDSEVEDGDEEAIPGAVRQGRPRVQRRAFIVSDEDEDEDENESDSEEEMLRHNVRGRDRRRRPPVYDVDDDDTEDPHTLDEEVRENNIDLGDEDDGIHYSDDGDLY